MRVSGALFAFLTVVSGFTFVTPPAGEFPLWSHLSQLNLFENLQPDIWLKNYSIVVASSPCPPVASMAEQSRIPGNIIVYNYAESSGRCSYRQVTNTFNAFNPVGHLFLNFFGFARAIGTNNPYALVSNAHPVWHTGANPNLQLKDAFSSFPVALFAPNATVLLT